MIWQDHRVNSEGQKGRKIYNEHIVLCNAQFTMILIFAGGLLILVAVIAATLKKISMVDHFSEAFDRQLGGDISPPTHLF